MHPVLATLALLALLASSPTQAQDEERRNAYAGVSLSYAENAGMCDDDLAGHQHCTGAMLVRAFGGYHFNRHFALEGALHTLERSGGGALEVSAVGSLPTADDDAALYGRIGVLTADRGSALTLAAGLRFYVGKSFGLRFEWQGYYGEGSADTISVGAFLRF